MGKAMSIMTSLIDISGQIHPREVVVFGAFEIDLSQFNFNDRSSRIGWIRVSSYIFIVLVFLAVALRVFARIRYVRRLFTDDRMFHAPFPYQPENMAESNAVLIIAAAIFTIALSAACIAGEFAPRQRYTTMADHTHSHESWTRHACMDAEYVEYNRNRETVYHGKNRLLTAEVLLIY